MPRRRRHAEHKGVSLPINMIVILSIAVLVLVVLAAYFIGVFSRNSDSIGDQDAWNRGCPQARARGCVKTDFNPGGLLIDNYDPDKVGGNNDLFYACKQVYGQSSSNDDCWKHCCGV